MQIMGLSRNAMSFQGVQFQARPHKVAFGWADMKSLMEVFQAVPKVDLHCHLSGSVPEDTIADFMVENGAAKSKPAALQIINEKLKDHYTSLDDFLDTYYQIPAQVKTPEQFRRGAAELIKASARDNVRRLEIRSSILSKGGATPELIADSIEAGIRDGKQWVKVNKGYDMSVGLIVLAQRAGKPTDSLESAKLAVRLGSRPGSSICGFDLAGSEGKHAVTEHAEALNYAKRHGVPVTVHAGETETSQGMSGAASIRAALNLGAKRIGHGIQAVNDPELMNDLRDKQTPIEVCPDSNVQLSSVPDYPSHPLPQMLNAGLNVSLNTDNRMISKMTLTQQLGRLYANGLLPCWEQLKTLTLNGGRSAFLGTPFTPQGTKEWEMMKLLRDIRAQFAQVEMIYKNVINQYFCKSCKHPQSETLKPDERRLTA